MFKRKLAKPDRKDLRQRRAALLVDKLLEVDDLKKVSGWGPACRACAFKRPY